ncbi:hypothetical protein [Prauserella cavernicola]|uniref:Uncharacterized protein n=1 Tax=Prauserella cavernicola TaxID=2800127 RepID=A0A934V3U0_9PSEU|nr:hypothetical protein [Prauserella cavernicola]MBK1783415.1 hypothetical protein [Prauserella cavernicola]
MTSRDLPVLVGAAVSYRQARDRSARRGHVVAPPVFDRYASTWWVAVLPDGTPDDTEPDWVREANILTVLSDA